MIGFKGAHFPKDIILHAVFSMSSMPFPIETLKKFWKIKEITKPMMGFSAFHSVKATIDGIETSHMIRKGQLSDENISSYKQFMAAAG